MKRLALAGTGSTLVLAAACGLVSACGGTTSETPPVVGSAASTAAPATSSAAATPTVVPAPAVSSSAAATPTAEPAPVATSQPTATPTAAPAASAAPSTSADTKAAKVGPGKLGDGKKEIEISLRARSLEVDKAKKKVLYEQERGVMTNHYHLCDFDYAELVRVVGKENLEKPMRLVISVGASQVGNSSPSDPKLPQPAGGFIRETYSCKVLKLVAVE